MIHLRSMDETGSLKLQKIRIREKAFVLYVPDPVQVKKKISHANESPYWSRVWPASLALGEFILQHPDYIKDKRVLELGAGLGLPSLVAAAFARHITCSDLDPRAVKIMQQTFLLHCLQHVEVQIIDWNSIPRNLDADVVLLSDINYDPAQFQHLELVIKNFLIKKTTLLLSTPQRLMAKSFINTLMPYCTAQYEIPVLHGKEQVLTTIFVLQ